jgi:hypothetical protein
MEVAMQPIEIRIKGQIDRDWSDWLGSLAIVHTTRDETVISGVVRDQAAIYGILHQLSSLGLQLLSVTCTGKDTPDKQGGSVNVMVRD